MEKFAKDVDEALQQKNSYYKDLIDGNILRTLVLRVMKKNAFIEYMKNTLFIFFLLFIGCSHKNNNSVPKDIIAHDKMVNVLVDFYLVESANNLSKMQGDTAKPGYADLFETIFKKYSITKADYEKSMKYYTENTKQLDNIYDEVLAKLNLMGVMRDER